ncbi:hypothetical protein GLOIN_2v1811373 [Rhizophagus irregularis DAOM 181602=DAOM 197198]|uniref:Uncharacterized protein n=1 Tax=Rhizophagus irregularis (strain DAOM 181602 / DAOM 197198 / MUCL 43194) TaxID=747089 RepID=A0A2P4PAA8_RHIID|nr:hypothetical protein GLOIN_2v1811373 [Rhizophagus irregularis DAOM 181602=DAOM 197198]POG62333.1 hypothetical protein GLOIN_2v1811373 [Rhizophagus irregularis DAOM 181602=DAOM 197198]|eukprot:XP_025169199.1 hypothetical protein GLOIN_2v1811373 [Rhizophagus irregularis DAOM 181602=DAOM 197198]
MDDIKKKKISFDKKFTFDDGRHNGKPITTIAISPNEKYLITYSEKDRSIVGWNVEDKDKVQLKFDQTVKINEDEIICLCVSDDKKLAYINVNKYGYMINIIDMNNEDKKIALSFDKNIDPLYCTFNLKVYLFSNDYICEWNINTEKRVNIFVNNKDKNKIETKNIGIFSNEKFNILKVNDKIIVYSIELGIIIASLDINDGNHF